jgi:GT2 family glycosyltransferase
MSRIGIVAIGRNEGDRLRRCLDSVAGRGLPVVYVDSGSTDGSIELARAKGVEVVELDMSRPFTMARARNAGFARLEEIAPGIRFVQFVDGDCEVVAGWLEHGLAAIEGRPDVAAVSGRRRERFPDRSIYNRFADIEWRAPSGAAKYCGGDVLIRAEAFRQVGGYDPALIAGEDPELSVRLRQRGWTILRVDAEMTLHDMAMTRFGQWWKRAERSGFAFAEGAAMHGKLPERHWVREVKIAAVLGIALPMTIFAVGVVLPMIVPGLARWARAAGLLLVLIYPILVFRWGRRYLRAGLTHRDAWLYSGACVLGGFPNAIGAVRYWVGRLLRRRQPLIEYKDS